MTDAVPTRLMTSLALQLETAYALATALPPDADASTLVDAIDDARACAVRLNEVLVATWSRTADRPHHPSPARCSRGR